MDDVKRQGNCAARAQQPRPHTESHWLVGAVPAAAALICFCILMNVDRYNRLINSGVEVGNTSRWNKKEIFTSALSWQGNCAARAQQPCPHTESHGLVDAVPAAAALICFCSLMNVDTIDSSIHVWKLIIDEIKRRYLCLLYLGRVIVLHEPNNPVSTQRAMVSWVLFLQRLHLFVSVFEWM